MGKTILIIDDEEEIRSLLVDIQKEGIFSSVVDVYTAKEGQEGLEIFEQKKPDLIILDYSMPKMNGLETLISLRERGAKVPVIWLTGLLSQEIYRDAWRLGVYDFIEKPFDIFLIAKCIMNALDMGESIDEKKTFSFLNKSHFKEINLFVDKDLIERFQKNCSDRGISMSSRVSDLIISSFKAT